MTEWSTKLEVRTERSVGVRVNRAFAGHCRVAGFYPE